MSEKAIFDASLLDRLACPACLGRFFLGEDQLVCVDCQRAYPIVDGIPALIANRMENSLNI